MINQEIIGKAVEKAEKNGFNIVDFLPAFPPKKFDKDRLYKFLLTIKNEIIWNHSFLKTFFVDDEIKYRLFCDKCNDSYYWSEENKEWTNSKYCSMCATKLIKREHKHYKSWRSHAMNMVLQEEPLKYIEKYL